MNTLDSIRNFKMYRGRLENSRLTEEHLTQLVDAARWAPSGHNSQPWEFLFVDDPVIIEKIADIATRNFDEFLAHGPHLVRWIKNFSHWLRWSREELEERGDGIYFKRWSRAEWEELAISTDEDSIRAIATSLFGSHGESSRLIRTAPCLLFTLLNSERESPDYSHDLLALTSAGAAMQNLRLAALELGIAVHEQALLYDLPETREAVSGLLGIPDHFTIAGGMRLGYRTGAVRSSYTNVRRPVADLAHRNAYSG